MLISEQWRALNADLHERNPRFGAGGWRWANAVCGVAERYGCKTVLDYGCGKNTLAMQLNGALDVRSYDPAVPEFAADPEPADMLVSIDVLEHIEPELLDPTLDHMAGLTRKVALLLVGTRPSDKSMRDQRNAHLIIEPMGWWLERLGQRWRIVEAQDASESGFFRQWRRPMSRPRGVPPIKAPRNIRMAPGMEFRCLCVPRG